MGKREIRRWRIFTLQGSIIFGLSGIFFLGAAVGCLFAVLVDQQGVQELEQYLRQYFIYLQKKEAYVSFWTVLWYQSRYLLVAGLLGFTSIGVFSVPFLFGCRGFLLSFSIAVCYRIFGTAGLWTAGILFGIPAFFWFPSFLFVGGRGAANGLWLLCRRTSDAGSIIQQPRREYSWIIYAAGFLLTGALLEYAVVPVVVEVVLRMI